MFSDYDRQSDGRRRFNIISNSGFDTLCTDILPEGGGVRSDVHHLGSVVGLEKCLVCCIKMLIGIFAAPLLLGTRTSYNLLSGVFRYAAHFQVT